MESDGRTGNRLPAIAVRLMKDHNNRSEQHSLRQKKCLPEDIFFTSNRNDRLSKKKKEGKKIEQNFYM